VPGRSAAITPYLIWIALGTGVAAGGAVVGYIQQVRVGHLKNEVQSLRNDMDQLRSAISDRDGAIKSLEGSQRTLVASTEKCSASVASLAEQGQERRQEVSRLV
jgi:chromosome segregation ATPase